MCDRHERVSQTCLIGLFFSCTVFFKKLLQVRLARKGLKGESLGKPLLLPNQQRQTQYLHIIVV